MINCNPVKRVVCKKALAFLMIFLFFLSLQTAFVSATEVPIINGKTKMAPGEKQVLSIMNYQTGSTPTWQIESGGGSLSAVTGERVTYTAPATNPNCTNNPTISVKRGETTGTFRIAITANVSGNAYKYISPYYHGVKGTNACCVKCGVPPFFEPSLSCAWFAHYSCSGEEGCPRSFHCEWSGYYRAYQCVGAYGCGYGGGPCPKQFGWEYPKDLELCMSYTMGSGKLVEFDSYIDIRTAQMKANGCCPEELLPGYAPKKTAPINVDFGKDPDVKYPVCDIEKIGNPISIYSGNNFEFQTDLSFPSPGSDPFVFKRYYNSRSAIIAGIGYGWTHNYRAFLNTAVEHEGAWYLRIIDETGRSVYFADQGGGLYSGAFKERSHVQVEKGGYVWYRPDGRRFVFDAGRNLIRIELPSGHQRMLTYDAANRLTAVADEAGGRNLGFNYNSAGRIESISGPITEAVQDGIWVRYEYDGSGNLVSVGYADGSGFDYEYSNPADHNLTAKKDKQGHLLSSWSYDSQDRAVSSFTRDGKGVGITYVSDNEVRVTDAYGVARIYTIWDIDGRKKITDISSPTGCADCGDEIKRIEYDRQGRVIEVEFTGGRINQYADFDGRGNARIVKEAVGTADEKTVHYTFHPEIGATLTKTEESLFGTGHKVTIWDFDDDGNDIPNENPTRRVYRLIERGFTRDTAGYVVPFDRITAYTYDSKGQVLTIDGPAPGAQDLTAFSYHAPSGDLLAVTRPLVGRVSYSDYDGAGQVGRVTDENGQITLYTYDGRGRIQTITRQKDGAAAVFRYNPAGNLYEITDPDGIAVTFAYDNVYGRLTYAQDALGGYQYYVYDYQGNITEQSIHTSHSDRVFQKRFNYQGPQHPGKLWLEINPDNTYTEYSYDAGGNLQAAVDPAGKTTFYHYDRLSRLITVSPPGNAATSYGYDRHDNLTAVTDAESRQTTYAYDDLGRLLSIASPDTGVTTYAYDISGNLISKIDAGGTAVQYAYDVLNRLTAIYYPDSDQNVFFSYDQGQNGRGRLAGIQDPSGILNYGYDLAGRLIRETRTINGVEFNTLYAYSPAGRVREIIYPNGRIIRYRYGSAGRIEKVVSLFEKTEAVLADEIVHLPFGPIASMRFGNGLALSSRFDQLYRLESSQSGDAYSRSLSYDLSGNVSAFEDLLDPYRSQAFGYDELNRLTEADGSYGALVYTYDKAGNRLSKNRNGTVDIYRYIPGANRLSEAAGMAYTYDANGNPTSMGTKSLFYNQNNRLIRAAENGSVLGEYSYNALGQRTVKRADGQTSIYIYDRQGSLITEADSKGNVVNEYIYLEGRLLAGIKSGKPLVEAALDMDPDTLNLDSRGNWVTAYIKLPQGYDVAEIDPATIMLNQSVDADWVKVEDHDGDGVPDLMVKFDRSRVSAILQPGEAVEIVVEGEADSYRITGTDTIRVISKGNRGKKEAGPAAAAQTASSPPALSKSSRLFFYHLDHLGTPQVVTDETGEVVWSADYLPFGQVSITADAVGNDFRFPGQYHDAETGLHYNYFRYYDPKTGRYLTPDPIGLAGMDPNIYGYVLNNPILFVDPFGLDRYSDVVTFTTSVIGIGVSYVKTPTTIAGATAFTVSILADKANATLAFSIDSRGKAFTSAGLSAVGTGAAFAGGSPLVVLLSSYGLGTAINNLPIYGNEKTISEWWIDYIWNKLHNKINDCENAK